MRCSELLLLFALGTGCGPSVRLAAPGAGAPVLLGPVRALGGAARPEDVLAAEQLVRVHRSRLRGVSNTGTIDLVSSVEDHRALDSKLRQLGALHADGLMTLGDVECHAELVFLVLAAFYTSEGCTATVTIWAPAVPPE
jgi:hypothetical protein